MPEKISLLTSATPEYWDLLKLTAPNKLEYCLRWGLQLSVRRHTKISDPWGEREVYMLQALTECDWLMFMGADTLIMNQAIDVRSFINDDYDFIIGVDIHGINNDVFFLRNTAESKAFLEKTLFWNGSIDTDQAAMSLVMNETKGLRVKQVHQKLFNSYLYSEYTYPDSKGGDYSDGDFVLHLPGMSNARRIELVNQYLPKVIR
jgi:hypothetical protein